MLVFPLESDPYSFQLQYLEELKETTGLYALFCSVIVLSLLALRKKLDKKAGIVFIALYFFSYATMYT